MKRSLLLCGLLLGACGDSSSDGPIALDAVAAPDAAVDQAAPPAPDGAIADLRSLADRSITNDTITSMDTAISIDISVPIDIQAPSDIIVPADLAIVADSAVIRDLALPPLPDGGAGVGCQGGALRWARATATRVSQLAELRAFDLAAAGDGSLTVAGWLSGTLLFGQGTPYQAMLGGGQLDDPIIARFAPDGSFRWGRTYSTSGGGGAIAVRVLADGTSLVAGQFDGSITLDYGLPTATKLTAAGGQNDYDTFLARVDANGNLLWVRQLGGPAFDFPWRLDARPDGTAVLTGRFGDAFSDTITLNAGRADAITLTRPRDHYEENFVAGYDGTGHLQWAHAFGGTSRNDQVRGTAFLSDGTIFLTGQFDGGVDFDNSSMKVSGGGTPNLVLVHYLAGGTFDWARAPLGGASVGYSVAQSPTGELLVSASADGAVVFGQGEATQAMLGGKGGSLIARYAETGGLLGIHRFGSSLVGYGMAVAQNGDVAVVGDFYYQGMFATPGGDVTLSAYGWEDAYALCAPPSGNVGWYHRMGGIQHDFTVAAVALSGGDLVVAGTYDADIAFDGAGVKLPNDSYADLTFLARYSF